MQNENYFSHAWALLTRDKGWIKPILVLTVSTLVPVAGFLGCQGYYMEWSRLTAWGVDSAPKQRNVKVGACIASGWRGFVVGLGWYLCYAIVASVVNILLAVLPSYVAVFLGSIVGLVGAVIGALFSSMVMVAKVRTAIYEKIGAGYQVNRIIEMIRRDLNGFMRVFVINFLAALAIGIVAAIFVTLFFVAIMPVLMVAMHGGDSYSELVALASCIVWIALVVLFAWVVCTFMGVVADMLGFTATGLWMRQFDVPSWGRSEEPLP